MYTKEFWKDAIERSISTAAQAVLLAVGASDNVLGLVNHPLDLPLMAYAALGGFTLALLKALALAGVKR